MLEKRKNNTVNERAKEEKRSAGFKKTHFSNLHDQDVDEAGNQINPATGKRYNNSSDDPGAPELSKGYLENVLPPLSEENDLTAEWLRNKEKNLKKPQTPE